MDKVFGLSEKQPIIWYKKNKESSNQHCLYCGEYIGLGSYIESNKEHLIARKFVPIGSFKSGKEFNFIFGSCKQCNDEKADLERHISSISLFTTPERKKSAEIDNLAINKANSDFHPDMQGKKINESFINKTVAINLGPGINMKFGTISPPQLKSKWVELLALRHIQGFIALISSRDPTTASGTSILLPQYFHLFGYYNFSDWGNNQLIEIINRTADWETIGDIDTASGFFKVIIKKNPKDKTEYYWGLEWNKSIRIVGNCHKHNSETQLFRNISSIDWVNMKMNDGSTVRMRKENKLDKNDDIMFNS